jgi:threonine synthase
MRLVQEVCHKNNIYLANSMNSLRIEGQKTVSVEILQQLDWEMPDWVIIPGGNLGHMGALGKGFLLMEQLGLINRRPRLACAQAANANPLYESYLTGFKEFKPKKAKKTLASAIQIGNPVSVRKAIAMLKEFDGVVEQATENELANAAALADTTGLFCCPHTGVALAVLFKLLKQGVIKSGERVIVISTAHGLKFTDFKLKYHTRKLKGIDSVHINEPIDVPAEYGKVVDVINRELDRRTV